ncbi:hypothetical protein [Paenibacillus sp.]|nr:hypothetical protein [Paenibacillus sp.]
MGFHKKHRHVKKINVVKIHKKHLNIKVKQFAAAKVGKNGNAIAINANAVTIKKR